MKMNMEMTLTSLALNRLRKPMLTNNIYCRNYYCIVVVNILFITPINLSLMFADEICTCLFQYFY